MKMMASPNTFIASGREKKVSESYSASQDGGKGGRTPQASKILKAKDLEKRLTNQMKDMEKLLRDMHKSVTS